MNYFVIPGIARPIVKPKSLTFFSEKRILSALTRYFEIEPVSLLAKNKKYSIVFKRQIGMYLMSKHTDYTFRGVAATFGKKDHSTVYCARKTVEDRMDTDERIANMVKEISENI